MKRDEKEKKLNTLPWQALHDNAIKNGIPKEEVSNKDKKTVVQTILSYDVFDDEKIEELLNDYIYGDRITFTLWKMGNVALSAEQIDVIWGLEGAFVQDLNISHFKEFKVLSIKEVQERYEILYVYLKEYTYINENGYMDSVWEQHRGCAWIGTRIPYIACISKHDKMTMFISSFLSEKLRTNINQIKPPRNAIEKCISEQAISRKVLQGVNGEKTIISNSIGLTEEQLSEMERISNERIDTSGSYIAQIEDNIRATIKYNISKGNIGIYKHLPANILFEWSQKAIEIIFEEIEKLKENPIQELAKALGVELKWSLLSSVEKEGMNSLLSHLLKAMNEKEYQVPIETASISVLQKDTLFLKIARLYCEECDGYEIAYCKECGEEMCFSKEDGLICPNCSGRKAVCSEGHNQGIIKYIYIPTAKCKEMLRKNLSKVYFDNQDFILCVIDNILNISVEQIKDEETEVQFDSVECFSKEGKELKDVERYRTYAVKMNEKCNGTCSHKKVNQCVTDKTMVCLPKIFYNILPNYRPQPHKGGEYGDVWGEIQVNNHTYEMKGIIKKNTKNNGRNAVEVMLTTLLLSTSKEGTEIIRQFVQQGMNDQRCNLIAVIAPQYFDADLKGTLRYLAKLSGKKVLFIDLDGVCKILNMSNLIND